LPGFCQEKIFGFKSSEFGIKEALKKTRESMIRAKLANDFEFLTRYFVYITGH